MSARRVAAGAATGIAGGAALIAAISVVARVVGFGRQLVFNSQVGVTLLGSVYSTANAIPNVVFEIVAGGALASVVVPLLAAAAQRGDTVHVRQTVSALLGWTLALLVPVALLGVLVAGPLIELMLRGQGGSAGVEAGRSMLVLFLPQIPLYGIAVVTAGTLQAHRRFLAAALAPVVSSVVVAGAYLVFGTTFTGDADDLGDLTRQGELILAGGTTLGVLALALTTLLPMLMKVTGLRPTLRFPPGIARRAAALAGAGLVTLLAQQMAYLTSYVTSNQHAGDGGAVTYLNSWMVYLLPYAVLAVPIATASFPRLAEYAEVDRAAYARTLAESTRAVLMVSTAGAAALIAAAWPVARFFDAIDQGDSAAPARMAWALVAFAPGLIGYGLIAHLGRALYARRRGRTAAAATSTGWLLVVLLAVVLTALVPQEKVTAALGLAHTAGMTVAGVLLVAGVIRDSGRTATTGVVRVLALALLAGAAGGACGWLVAGAFPAGGAGTQVVAGVAAGMVVATVMAAVLWALMRGELTATLRRRRAAPGHEPGAGDTRRGESR
ncbi:putative peptidoglycan lipid II flippase [Haloactinopolyspora alba]|uniref:Putative peptidoglycan lipid II flippase n=1 Tax=Haloactinopolyspora alba TaxID=648780 RepID=A0A2P8E237_9ACTN|nr:lipid II flippase MurJ [Haloactinopolyspora alba]PSL03534.1 putative peptidoglycan lipid II flippase [Haloactinopolyspora alba]